MLTLIILFMYEGILQSKLIEESELDWYLENTTVYKVRDLD